jgi:protein phosphatase
VLDWVLIVSVLFIIIAIAIAVVLVMLVRRARRPRQTQPEAAVVEQPPEVTIPAVAAETDPEATVVISQKDEVDDTSPSLPVVTTVTEPETLPISGQRPATISWQIAGLTDVGLKRELNEDNLLMIEAEMAELGPYGLYIVADGLGGHAAGEVASRLTIETIQERHTQFPPAPGGSSFEEWLKDSTRAANEVVLRHQQEHAEDRKMGSTLVMALVIGDQAYIVNVGDSRAYRLNNEKIEQISVDHSLVERLIQIGQITREEARTHKQKNVIYSTIGEKRKMEIGSYHISLSPGDRLLLCSDGLSSMVSDEELLKISRDEPNPARAVQMMVEMAKQAGGQDNITTILIQMNGV